VCVHQPQPEAEPEAAMATARTVKDVSPHEFVKAYSSHLKRSGKVIPSLVSTVASRNVVHFLYCFYDVFVQWLCSSVFLYKVECFQLGCVQVCNLIFFDASELSVLSLIINEHDKGSLLASA